jgi:murein L,D-transpeptidase YcbB/YkuD
MVMRVLTIAALVSLTACGVLPGRGRDAQRDATKRSVERLLSARELPVFVSRDREGTRLWSMTRTFYKDRAYEPAWIDGRRPRGQMDDFIGALQKADREGLDPELYSTSALAERRKEAGRGFLTAKGFDEAEAVRLDVWLTYLYLHYASDLANGLADLAHADPDWQIRDDPFDPVRTLADALERDRVAQSLEDLLPVTAEYGALRDALARYREIERQGGWHALPRNLRLDPGQRSAAVPALAKRLATTGDYAGTVDDHASVYDNRLQEAVRRFQRRQGLEANAKVRPALVSQLNVPVAARIKEIELSLERWRWLPRDLGSKYILVNIPEYRLEVWDHGRVPLAMNVVVGKTDTPTPIFSDRMTYLVFAPYWNMPADIVEQETLPSVMSDPGFLERANIEVLDKEGKVIPASDVNLEDPSAYRFRQRPGTANSLGLVKFMFPNQYNVYLHDTPADSLFARATRSFSHGCVRLENPEALAAYVLSDQPSWSADRIQEAMHAEEETTVKLKEPVPVYLGYWTARVSPDGVMQFRDDVYGVDARQTSVLDARLAKLKRRADAAATTALVEKKPRQAGR